MHLPHKQEITPMFTGRFTGRLDHKGRIALPAPLYEQFRAYLSQTPKQPHDFNLVLVRDVDPCLALYPLPIWINFQKQLLQRINWANPQHRRFLRTLAQDVYPLKIDGHNRILIPERLRQHAQLQVPGEVVILALAHRAELWNPKLLEQQGTLPHDELTTLGTQLLPSEFFPFLPQITIHQQPHTHQKPQTPQT